MRAEDLLRPLASKTEKLSVGCGVLDRLLCGGIPCGGSITEIVAESGTGKTQLSLQLLLAAQLPASQGGLNGASLYLHSELSFPIRRLSQLSFVYRRRISHDPLDRVFVEPLHSADHLLDVLPRLDFLVPKLNIKIIVVDSIAALFRGEFDNTPVELKRRSCMFFKISSKLRSLGHKFGLAVVITNQVVDVIEHSYSSMSFVTSGRRVSPALGLSWANCVNTRLYMWRQDRRIADAQVEEGAKTRRFIGVAFAPHLANSSVEFEIRRDGLFGIEEMMSIAPVSC